jgi:glycosyltransferase involved in cell wall biosynthesis
MNLGIRMAHGRWIAVLDADDWYAPSRLSTLLATGECANVQLVADNQFVYDEGAAQVVRTALRATTGHKRLDKPEFVAGCDPYAEFDLGMLKPVVRTEFVHKANLSYRESARLSEDFLYLLEFFAAGGEGCLISRPLYYWRQAFGSLSRHWTASGHGAWRYDFLSGARASEDVLEALRQRGDRELARMLQRRIRAFHRLHRLQEVNRKRAAGAPLRDVAATVAMHPSIWSLIAQRLLRRFNASRDHESLSGVH